MIFRCKSISPQNPQDSDSSKVTCMHWHSAFPVPTIARIGSFLRQRRLSRHPHRHLSACAHRSTQACGFAHWYSLSRPHMFSMTSRKTQAAATEHLFHKHIFEINSMAYLFSSAHARLGAYSLLSANHLHMNGAVPYPRSGKKDAAPNSRILRNCRALRPSAQAAMRLLQGWQPKLPTASKERFEDTTRWPRRDGTMMLDGNAICQSAPPDRRAKRTQAFQAVRIVSSADAISTGGAA